MYPCFSIRRQNPKGLFDQSNCWIKSSSRVNQAPKLYDHPICIDASSIMVKMCPKCVDHLFDFLGLFGQNTLRVFALCFNSQGYIFHSNFDSSFHYWKYIKMWSCLFQLPRIFDAEILHLCSLRMNLKIHIKYVGIRIGSPYIPYFFPVSFCFQLYLHLSLSHYIFYFDQYATNLIEHWMVGLW